MDFFLIYVLIAVIVIFLFNVVFKPKFECPECKTIHSKGDAKSQKATSIRYRHTRKDGNRDRRFNQSGTQHYDLTFECKNCGTEFVEDYGGIIDNYLARRRHAMAKEMLKDNPELEKAFRELDDEARKVVDFLDVRSGEKPCPKCKKIEVGHIIEDCA